MPQFKSLLFFSFVLFLALHIPQSLSFSQNNDLRLLDVRYGIQENASRIVLEINKVPPFRAFVLSNPYRLVIDTPRMIQNFESLTGGTEPLIKQYRFGHLQPQVSRLVFEINQPFIINKVFFLKNNGTLPPRLVLDISGETSTNFEKKKNTVYGDPTFIQDMAKIINKAPLTEVSLPNAPQKSIGSSASTKNNNQKKIIMIDAGHGGNDPGAISASGAREKDITLAISRVLKKELESTGRYKAVLTRSNDHYIKLRDRVSLARKANADLFVSIHADSIHRKNVRGLSVYTLSETSSDKETARLAERENRSDIIAGVELDIEDDDVANILIDLAMRDTMNQSKIFANILVDTASTQGLKLLTNTHRYAGFAVLKAPDIPSILVETGYLSNDQDAHILQSKAYQKKISQALVKGIDGYFRYLESSN